MVYPHATGGRQLTKKQKVAQCSVNQPGLDRLVAEYEKAKPQSQYVQTLLRAIKSFSSCTLPISSQQEAMQLKCVGKHIARIICSEKGLPTATAAVAVATAQDEATTEPQSQTSHQSDSNNNKTKTTKARNPRKRKQSHVDDNVHENNSTHIINNAEDAAVAKVPPSNGNPCHHDIPSSKPTAKQKAYDDAVKYAMNLTLPPRGWKVLLLVDIREHRSDHVLAKCRMSGIPCEERQLPIGDMAWIARCEQKHRGITTTTTTTTTTIEVMLGTIIERKTAEDLTSSLFGTRYLEQRLRLQHCGLPQVLLLVEGDINNVMNCPADTLEMAMMETRIQLEFQIVQTKSLDDTVRLLKRVHRRVLQRSFPLEFDDDNNQDSTGDGGAMVWSDPQLQRQYLPTFASPTAAAPAAATAAANHVAGPRRQRRPSSLMEMLMDTPPVPPLGTTRFITYQELKCKVERDREAGTRTIGHVHAAMLKQVPSLSQKKAIAMAQAFGTPHALMTALHTTMEDGNHDGAKRMLTNITVEAQATRASTIGPKSAEELIVAYCTTRHGKVGSSNATTAGTSKPMAMSQDASSSSSRTKKGRTASVKDPPTKRSVARKPAAKSKRSDDGITLASSQSSSTPSATFEPTTSEQTLARLESLLASTKDLLSQDSSTTQAPPVAATHAKYNEDADKALWANSKELPSQDSTSSLRPPAAANAKYTEQSDDDDEVCVDLTQGNDSGDDDDDDDDDEDDDYRAAVHASLAMSQSQASVNVHGSNGGSVRAHHPPGKQPLPSLVGKNPATNSNTTKVRPMVLETKTSIISMHSTDMESSFGGRRNQPSDLLLSSQSSCEVIEID